MKFKITSLITVALFLCLMSCQEKAPKQQNKWGSKEKNQIKILTTTAMVADLVKNVGGDLVDIKALIGTDIDPHSYQTKLGDAVYLQQADIIFYNGLHLEGKMEASLEQIKNKPVVAITSQLTQQELLKPQEAYNDHYDPHVWGDPTVWASCIKPVLETLVNYDPKNEAIYKANANAYNQELQELHLWAQNMIGSIPEQARYLITSHDAFFYLGRAFNIQVEGIQGISTMAEASLKHQVYLVNLIKQQQIKTIFPESSVNPKAIKNLAEQSGAQVSSATLFSDAMGEPGDIAEFNGVTYDKGTYRGMLMHNIITITQGLSHSTTD